MPMNVILLERVPKLGQMGDVVKVKPGFARNFLLPQKKALRATKDNITYFESQRKVLRRRTSSARCCSPPSAASVRAAGWCSPTTWPSATTSGWAATTVWCR